MTMTETRQIVVIGGGSAGVAAALAAANAGARTLLVERDPLLGGDLISGLPILGCRNSLGEQIVGGVAAELIAACSQRGGYVGPVFDWRTLWGECVDPVALRLAIVEALADRGVELLLGRAVSGVAADGGSVGELTLCGSDGAQRVEAEFVVDCTGDAAIAHAAGAECELGGPGGEFQPVSLVFQMANVDARPLLRYVRDHPGEAILADNPIIGRSPAECAEELYEAGHPYMALSAEGSLLGDAIASGEMYPCTAIFMSPTSTQRREVTLNSTRLADLDATDPRELSRALPVLIAQVERCVAFARKRLPGFGEATLARVAPRIGIRETRRLISEHVLSAEEVIEGRKCAEVVAKGGHHVDIHGSGTYQKRVPVSGGRSYDIPYGCLIPRTLANVLVAGRCLSSTREANGSARVMGTCMATGQAAGVAAALCALEGHSDVRELPLELLQRTLRAQAAILDGTA
jgi:hypothetical protein